MHGGGLYTIYMHKTSQKTNKLDSTKKKGTKEQFTISWTGL